MKRQRGRSRRNGTSNNNGGANRSFESNGPDVKVRGTAKQIYDKYETMARDAMSSGSRVKAENYRQHAEHYLRIVNEQEGFRQVQQAQRDEAKASDEDLNADFDSDSDSDSDSETADASSPAPKRSRRYPPQARRDNGSENNNDAEDDGGEMQLDAEPKAATRRKAPTRAPKKSTDGSAPESEPVETA